MKFIIYFLLFFTLSWQACTTAQKTQIPDKVNIPDSFAHAPKADSSSIAQMQWKQFFADTFLQHLIDTALHNNPDILIAFQHIETARAMAVSARNATLPSLNGVISAGVDNYGDYTMNGVGNYDTNLSPNISKDQTIPDPTADFFIGLRSSWEVDVWGKLKNRKKTALAKLAASEKARQLATTLLVAQVAGYYYQLLALDNDIKIINHNTTLQEEALEIVKVQKEGGRATELAVQQMEAQLYNTRTFGYKAKQEIALAEFQLNYLLGRFPQAVPRDTIFTQQHLPQQLQTGLPSALLLQRPDIQEAEWQLLAAKADVASARAAFMPGFQITPYAGFNAFKAALLFNGGSLAWGALGSLTAPLFNQKQIKAAHLIAVAQNKEAYYHYNKVILNSFREVGSTIQQLENNSAMVTLKQKQVTALEQAVASSRDLYLAGYASYLEVITAQKGVLDAQLELNDARKNQLTYTIDLYRSLGGGWQ
ncbi:efflux transporter, outer membrane factor (OMF) lipoprotein, NodT family [Filimonas lacunae]|uniref:Efflux transporter, outer membrane factor (OMF) lipoprotein, NodT family n=1 Tax=Filimonas lacunae TaxID=477680 RepID=A0A173MNK8_9BACT|nr:TolC family protein [Filimonas lacunae]BAV08981.1 RND efflux system, outer membrane lipoprotein, NodT family [Filimonas lacunae]SIS65194.1 efflux transporter, outer membrane factor (OMF) lipoprotein, NodT family [Filimonas lacunae]